MGCRQSTEKAENQSKAAETPASPSASEQPTSSTQPQQQQQKQQQQQPEPQPSSSSSSSGMKSSVDARIQAVSSRLDQVVPAIERLKLTAMGFKPDSSGMMQAGRDPQARLAALTERLEKVAAALEVAATRSYGGPTAGGSSSVELTEEEAEQHPSVLAFDEVLTGPLRQFLELSNKVGGEVKEVARWVQDAFVSARRFLPVVPQSREPGPKILEDLLRPTFDCITKASEFRESHRKSKYFNHLSAISEGIPALSWMTMAPKVCPFIQELIDATEFHTNRVVMEFKEKDKVQADWARSFIALLKALHAYVKAHHVTGAAWGTKVRSGSFWSKAIAQVLPSAGDAEKFIFK